MYVLFFNIWFLNAGYQWWHYSKCKTRADEIGKCLDEGLEPTYCFGIFNLLNLSRQYSKHQTSAEEIEKCLDEGLEPTYYLSIFNVALSWSYLFLSESEANEINQCFRPLPSKRPNFPSSSFSISKYNNKTFFVIFILSLC